jgi:hypothetical protein
VSACTWLLLALAVALVAAGCGSSSKLGASSLAKQADALQSLSAEGALLAGDAASGRTTGVYRREHSSELSSAASKAARSLTSARTAPALAPDLRRLRALATRVSSRLQRLGGASKPDSRSLARELQAAATAAEKISKQLA